jgi:hypothetical protein
VKGVLFTYKHLHLSAGPPAKLGLTWNRVRSPVVPPAGLQVHADPGFEHLIKQRSVFKPIEINLNNTFFKCEHLDQTPAFGL